MSRNKPTNFNFLFCFCSCIVARLHVPVLQAIVGLQSWFMKTSSVFIYPCRNEVVPLVDNDTILFIFGDHGMTSTGDHGGETDMETSAALIVYSARPLFNLEQVMRLLEQGNVWWAWLRTICWCLVWVYKGIQGKYSIQFSLLCLHVCASIVTCCVNI